MTIQTEEKKETTYYITPVGRLSYAYVFKPRKKENESDRDVYDCTLILESPKNMAPDELERYKRLKQLVDATKEKKWPNSKTLVTSPFRHGMSKPIILDGYNPPKPLPLENNPEYIDKIVIKGVSYGRKPKVKDEFNQPLLDPDQLYSGCYGRLWLTAFAYDKPSRGISFGLQGVMKVTDGEPLGGGGGNDEAAFKSVAKNLSDDFKTVTDDVDW